MMKTIVLYIITILAFNILILELPILICLLSLTLTNEKIIDSLLWLFIPLAICSLGLTLIMGCKIALKKSGVFRWTIPVLISFVGFSPIWLTYLSLASISSLFDRFLILFSPVLLGLTSSILTHIINANGCRRLLG